MSIILRFISGTAWDSHVIEWDTRCKWSHVEAMWSPTLTLGAQLIGGVCTRSITADCYRNVSEADCQEVPSNDEQCNAFWEFLQQQIGKPYDWRAIVSFGLGQRDWTEEDSWFCSELQARALQLAGLLHLPHSLPVNRITPRDLWMLLIANRLWTGATESDKVSGVK